MKKLALLITTTKDQDFGHVKCSIVTVDDGKVRNYRADWDEKPYRYYDDLSITCQISQNTQMKDQSYAWCIEYRDKYSVTISKAEKMLKTLKSITKKLNNISNKYGFPESFGQYVANVANAIKADTILDYRKESGWSYDDCEFYFNDIPTGKQVINSHVEKIWGELNENKAAA